MIKRAITKKAVVTEDTTEAVEEITPKPAKKIIKKAPKPIAKPVEPEEELDEDILEDEPEEELDEDEAVDEVEDEAEEVESEEDDSDDEEEDSDDDDDSDEDDDSDDEEESDEEEDSDDDDSDEDDDSEDEDEDEPKPVKKNKTKAAKKEKKEKEVEPDTPARALAKAAKENGLAGPAKGRRLYDKAYADTETVDTRSANKEENLNSFVSRLEENGLNFVFDGCKFATEKRAVAAAILESLEQSVLDCLFIKGTGFGFLNGRLDAKSVEPKLYPVIKGGNMTTPVIKGSHYMVTLRNAEFEKTVGLTYRDENNSSEVSFPVKDNGDGTYTVLRNGISVKKGDIVDGNGEIKKKTTGKKVAKKK